MKKTLYKDNNLIYNRLQLIEQPVCKLEIYSDIVECLLKYQASLEQNNKDKEVLLNNLIGEKK